MITLRYLRLNNLTPERKPYISFHELPMPITLHDFYTNILGFKWSPKMHYRVIREGELLCVSDCKEGFILIDGDRVVRWPVRLMDKPSQGLIRMFIDTDW